ncbi:rCG20156, isoform CRA_b [Rattus norvegicus]|uniref:RCG20156, isoform CRA_b n=1 Tax=Rattus norvegicus TaxID=10116 RepID=A6JFV7_RAT|nr:rCG20156, isoform CRA_b [Rattus norvegicus]
MLGSKSMSPYPPKTYSLTFLFSHPPLLHSSFLP